MAALPGRDTVTDEDNLAFSFQKQPKEKRTTTFE